MNAFGHSKFALVMAAHARVQGMVAENSHRLLCDNSVAYGEEAFNIEAFNIEELAREIAEHGWQADS